MTAGPRTQTAKLARGKELLVLQPSWQTHDFKVKMLDWSANRGSRLAYLCRLCGRRFCGYCGPKDQRAWAVDGDGHALDGGVSDRWLSEGCPRLFKPSDEEDRKRLREEAAARECRTVEMETPPVAYAIKINGRLLVQSCPFCASLHVHTSEAGLRPAPWSTSDRRLEYWLTRRED